MKNLASKYRATIEKEHPNTVVGNNFVVSLTSLLDYFVSSHVLSSNIFTSLTLFVLSQCTGKFSLRFISNIINRATPNHLPEQ
jgi:hypothetical protein